SRPSASRPQHLQPLPNRCRRPGMSQKAPLANPPGPNRGPMAADRFCHRRIPALFTPDDLPRLRSPPRPICLAAALVCLSLGALPLAAQGLGLGAASEDRPIAISAASGIEWQQDAQVYIAR